MNLPLFIAFRYLFARKSHNVINVISAISAIGMAVGTAALVIILSVYNGFDGIIRSSIDSESPDLRITPLRAKVFDPTEAIALLDSIPEVADHAMVLEENVYVSYDGRQGLATARGIEDGHGAYLLSAAGESAATSAVGGSAVTSAAGGSAAKGGRRLCAVGPGIARKLGVNLNLTAPLELYYPDREKTVSLANPTATLHSEKVWPLCIMNGSIESDNSLILVPLETMRSLLGYDTEVTSLDITLHDGSTSHTAAPAHVTSPARNLQRVQARLAEALGPDYLVADRLRQNETVFKMMRYEKLSVFLILIFVIIIVAFNIYGSLSMLIIEKTDDIGTLRAMGASDGTIRRIFSLEGWLVSLLGLICGLAFGLLACWLQTRLGLIKMPGAFVLDAYPVIINWPDIIAITIGVALIGWLIATLSSRTAR
ncbi:MAG: ABC transporter permease [Bacteroidales bacterium]|nr:ABC transporter permease [Bacteroidales bacterium]